MRPKIQLNHSGMRDLLRSADVRAEMHRRAERVAENARAIAPVRSGDYQRSIQVEDVTTDRAVGRVVADVPYALYIEARRRPLGRALDAARG